MASIASTIVSLVKPCYSIQQALRRAIEEGALERPWEGEYEPDDGLDTANRTDDTTEEDPHSSNEEHM